VTLATSRTALAASAAAAAVVCAVELATTACSPSSTASEAVDDAWATAPSSEAIKRRSSSSRF